MVSVCSVFKRVLLSPNCSLGPINAKWSSVLLTGQILVDISPATLILSNTQRKKRTKGPLSAALLFAMVAKVGQTRIAVLCYVFVETTTRSHIQCFLVLVLLCPAILMFSCISKPVCPKSFSRFKKKLRTANFCGVLASWSFLERLLFGSQRI